LCAMWVWAARSLDAGGRPKYLERKNMRSINFCAGSLLYSFAPINGRSSVLTS
jgi:hypothetical protein